MISDENRTKSINIRVTPRQLVLIDRRADREGVKTAALFYPIAKQWAEKEEELIEAEKQGKFRTAALAARKRPVTSEVAAGAEGASLEDLMYLFLEELGDVKAELKKRKKA